MISSGASELDHSARCIQKCFRGYRVRKVLALINLQDEAIVKLQSRWRGYLTRRPIKDCEDISKRKRWNDSNKFNTVGKFVFNIEPITARK